MAYNLEKLKRIDAARARIEARMKAISGEVKARGGRLSEAHGRELDKLMADDLSFKHAQQRERAVAASLGVMH